MITRDSRSVASRVAADRDQAADDAAGALGQPPRQPPRQPPDVGHMGHSPAAPTDRQRIVSASEWSGKWPRMASRRRSRVIAIGALRQRVDACLGPGRLWPSPPPSRPALPAACGRPPARQRHDSHRVPAHPHHQSEPEPSRRPAGNRSRSGRARPRTGNGLEVGRAHGPGSGLGIGAVDRRCGHADPSDDHRNHHHAHDHRPPRPQLPPARLTGGHGHAHGAGELHGTDQERGDAQSDAVGSRGASVVG
jgi:hypothetical protein